MQIDLCSLYLDFFFAYTIYEAAKLQVVHALQVACPETTSNRQNDMAISGLSH